MARTASVISFIRRALVTMALLLACAVSAAAEPEFEIRVAELNAEQKSDTCSPDIFLSSLIWSDVFEWMKENKEDLAFMPSEEMTRLRFEEEMKASQKYLSAFFSGLRTLSSRQKTYGLVFSQPTDTDDGTSICVWLVSENGIVARELVRWPLKDKNSTADLALADLVSNSLLFSTRGARRGILREKGKSCDVQWRSMEEIPTSTQPQSMEALGEAVRLLLPGTIHQALKQHSGEQARLLIVPTRGTQQVPFAALPLGNGYLVDAYVPMIVPSANDIVFAASSRESSPASTASKKRTALVVGDPDLRFDKKMCWPELPYAREEAAFVAKSY
jgi:hypothetical protein